MPKAKLISHNYILKKKTIAISIYVLFACWLVQPITIQYFEVKVHVKMAAEVT